MFKRKIAVKWVVVAVLCITAMGCGSPDSGSQNGIISSLSESDTYETRAANHILAADELIASRGVEIIPIDQLPFRSYRLQSLRIEFRYTPSPDCQTAFNIDHILSSRGTLSRRDHVTVSNAHFCPSQNESASEFSIYSAPNFIRRDNGYVYESDNLHRIRYRVAASNQVSYRISLSDPYTTSIANDFDALLGNTVRTQRNYIVYDRTRDPMSPTPDVDLVNWIERPRENGAFILHALTFSRHDGGKTVIHRIHTYLPR